MIDVAAVLVIVWAIYELGRSAECAEWCERQLRESEGDHARD